MISPRTPSHCQAASATPRLIIPRERQDALDHLLDELRLLDRQYKGITNALLRTRGNLYDLRDYDDARHTTEDRNGGFANFPSLPQ
jgi:hypothetical protein